MDLGIEWEVLPRTATDLLKGKLDCQEIDGVVEWWSCVRRRGELSEFYDSAGIERDKDDSCELNGRYYHA